MDKIYFMASFKRKLKWKLKVLFFVLNYILARILTRKWTYPIPVWDRYSPCWSDWIQSSQKPLYIVRCIWNDSIICGYHSPYRTNHIRPIRNIICIPMWTYKIIIYNVGSTRELQTVDNVRIKLIYPSIKTHWNQISSNSQFVDFKIHWIIFIVYWPNELLPNRIHFRT